MDEETRKKLEAWNKETGGPDLSSSKREGGNFVQEPMNEKMEGLGKEDIGKNFVPEKNNLENSQKATPIEEAEKKRVASEKERLKRIRTYETDAAEHVQKKKTSLASIVSAQKPSLEEGTSGKKQESVTKKIFSILLSIVLVAAGLGVLWGWYVFVYQDSSETIVGESDSSIGAEKVETIVLNNINRQNILDEIESSINNDDISLGEIYEVILSKKESRLVDEERREVVVPLTAREFLEGLDVRAPISIYRSLGDDFVYGVYFFDGNKPFLILKTTFFQNVFASMLKWEEFMLEDLSFFEKEEVLQETPTSEVEVVEFGTSTATTTQETAEEEEMQEEDVVQNPEFIPSFKDEVLFNRDARVLRDKDGEILILYTFQDQETLIITNDEDTLEEVLERISVAEFE